MRTLLTITMLLVISGPADAADEPKTGRPCMVNFTEEGSFFKGRTYKTWQEHMGIDYDKAFRRVAQAVAEDNWGSVNANKDIGVVTANQTVTAGKGSTAPLNVVVKERSGGVVRVDANFGIAGMQTTSTDAVRTELCKLVEAPSM